MSAGPLTQTGAAVVAAASLYELLAGQLGGGRAEGAAAINLVQQVLSAASPEVGRLQLPCSAVQPAPVHAWSVSIQLPHINECTSGHLVLTNTCVRHVKGCTQALTWLEHGTVHHHVTCT